MVEIINLLLGAVMKDFLIIILLFLVGMNPALASGGGGEGGSNYLPIDPPFVVNINNGNGFNFLQVNTELKLANPEFSGMVKHHMAAIRHIMIMLLSSQSTNEIRTLEGKELLREKALEAIQAVLEEETGDTTIEAVYFTGFVIQ
jgi:flagellar FliL protein